MRLILAVLALAAGLWAQAQQFPDNAVRKDANGNVSIGTPLPVPGGAVAGSINAKQVYVDGVAVGAGGGSLPAGCTDSGANGITCTGAINALSFTATDATKSGGNYYQGLTSGGVALAAGDVAGTAITYVLPTANGTVGQVLTDGGVTTCPTLPTGYPATCHLLTWANGPVTVGSGTATLGTGALAANTCAAAVTVAKTGVLTTDTITWTPNGDISGVTGYGAASTDGLIIYPYPTAGNVNFKVCNATSASITPGAVTLNFRVVR